MNLPDQLALSAATFWLGLVAGMAKRADLWRLAQLVLALSLFPLFFYLITLAT